MKTCLAKFTKFFIGANMAFKINDSCVNCGTCEPDCPVGAISEQGDKRVIDAGACISCGTCAAECPAEAIVEE
jgi:NAD-dependent dihydropyrimidine dehydrogenase PreA subunit